jgi:lysophospholipase L1-like esterase
MRNPAALGCSLLAAAACTHAAHAQPAHVAAIGDSLTDEYAEQVYGHLAKSWSQILVETGRIDMGPSAAAAGVDTWGEPRRTGFRDNWGRYGASTTDALTYGEQTGAAASVSAHGADYVVIFIGGNDFNPFANPAYDGIYWGTWSQQQALDYANQTVANIRTMVEAVEGRGASIVLASVLDFSFMGFMRNGRFSWQARERVTDVIRYIRDQTRSMAAEKSLVFLDLFRLNIDLFGTNQFLREHVLVGNVPINMQQAGETGQFGFIYDGVHPQRVIQSIWGEAILTALNARGAAIPHLTESEMLAIGGLNYGGADTLPQTLRPMFFYVQNFACPGDFDADGAISVNDIFEFLFAYFAGDVRADLTARDGVTVGDVFHFLDAYFSDCP